MTKTIVKSSDDERKKRMENVNNANTNKTPLATTLSVLAAIDSLNVAMNATKNIINSDIVTSALSKYRFVISASDDDIMYTYLLKYLKEGHIKSLKNNIIDFNKIDSRIKKCPIKYGTYFEPYDRRTIQIIHVSVVEEASSKGYNKDINKINKDHITITFFGKNAASAYNKFLKKIAIISDKQSRESVCISDSDGNVFNTKPKSLSNIFQHGLDKFISELDNAMKHVDVFTEFGESHKFGILLYGDPGCGKTTFLLALAKRYNADIFTLSLSDRWWKYTLHDAIKRTPKNKYLMIVIEDIDFYTINRDANISEEERKQKEEECKTVMADVFNVLDGFQVRDKIITAMTTNKIEDLDPGLIRYGRVDFKFKFHNLDRELQIKMLKRYNMNIEECLIDVPEEVTPATFRKYIMDKKMGIHRPYPEYEEYLREIERRKANKESEEKKKKRTARKKKENTSENIVAVTSEK